MTNWHLGTMGYGFQDWVGIFYPNSMKQSQYLKHYSRFFNAVEIDSTFYGTPKSKTVQRWYAQSPENFLICPKLPKIITHQNRLINSVDLTQEFVENISHLKEKLGVILIQLPPDFSINEFSALENFLTNLPKGPKYAVEFRNRTWDTQRTYILLKELRICWVSVEYIIMTNEIYRTTDFLYIRWIGYHGQFEKKDRIQKDTSVIMKEWKQKIDRQLGYVSDIFGFFNNDFAGHSPLSCNQFKELIGLPTRYPAIPKQRSFLE